MAKLRNGNPDVKKLKEEFDEKLKKPDSPTTTNRAKTELR